MFWATLKAHFQRGSHTWFKIKPRSLYPSVVQCNVFRAEPRTAKPLYYWIDANNPSSFCLSFPPGFGCVQIQIWQSQAQRRPSDHGLAKRTDDQWWHSDHCLCGALAASLCRQHVHDDQQLCWDTCLAEEEGWLEMHTCSQIWNDWRAVNERWVSMASDDFTELLLNSRSLL